MNKNSETVENTNDRKVSRKKFQLESKKIYDMKNQLKIAKSVEHVWLDRHLTLPKINVLVIVLYFSQLFCSTQLFRTRGICCNFVVSDSSETRALKADTKLKISNNAIAMGSLKWLCIVNKICHLLWFYFRTIVYVLTLLQRLLANFVDMRALIKVNDKPVGKTYHPMSFHSLSVQSANMLEPKYN